MFMERSLENSNATSVRRKTRSLDSRGLFESRAVNGDLNYATKRKHLDNVLVDSTRPLKKRNSRKDVSLIRRRKNTRNSNVLCSGDGVVSAKNSFDQTYLTNPISRSLSENAVSVPRRQRGFSGRKKIEACSLLNLGETALPITDNDIVVKKRSTLFGSINWFPSETKKNSGDDSMKNRFDSDMNSSAEEISSIHNGDLSPTGIPSGENKKRNFCAIKSHETLSCSVDTFQDDEENLEHNAARMLCSRFNSTRTRSNANRKLSMVPPTFFTSPFQKFADCDVVSPVVSEHGSLDGLGMVLRPRKQHTTRDMFRKRRHFYELLFKDLDANLVLHRRIKVFCPLDQNWYFGFVNGYDPERNCHLVRYDGRDEEWVNLKNERFKLLLFPSEVPENTGKNNLLVNGRSKSDENKSTADESCTNSFLDSEPIISWLARSTRHLKSTQYGLLKKQRISSLPASSELSTGRCEMFECMDTCYSQKCANILIGSSVIRERLTDVSEKNENRSIIFSKNEKVSIVYYRRRKYKSKQIFHKHIYNNIWVRTPRVLSPFIHQFCNMKGSNSCWRSADFCQLSSTINGGGLQKLSTPLIKLHQCNCKGAHTEVILGHAHKGKEVAFTHDLLMLKYGTIVAKSPLLELEIFFMDDTSGLKLFQFEHCISQVASASVLFLESCSFNESNIESMVNSQSSVVPLGLKFSCIHDMKKLMLFLFYNFSKSKEFKLSYLDTNFIKYCSVLKQLPLSECIFGVIRALQRDYEGLLISSVTNGASIIMVMQNMNCQSETFTKVNTKRLFVDDKHGIVSTFSLSFTTPPALFPGTQLKSISEGNISHSSLQYGAPFLHGDTGMFSCLKVVGCSVSGCFSNDGIKMKSNNYLNLTSNVCVSSRIFPFPQAGDGSAICCLNGPLIVGTSLIPYDFIHAENNYIVQVQKPQFCEHYYPENGVDMVVHTVKQSFKLFSNSNVLFDKRNPIGPRAICDGCRSITLSYPDSFSYVWPSGRDDNFGRFGNRPKRPRTQVSYMTPFNAHDGNSPKSPQYGRFCHKKIRSTSENKATFLSEKSEKKSGLLSCDANILVTAIDKGWRECGANVVLEFVDHAEWKLAVKLMGAMRYSYKAHQFLQAATSNRYTHDLLWKGGKDWILEFPKKDQWARFKEIYAECYNRNFHTTAVKNIPIPGVFLKEERDDNGLEVSFVRDPSIYFRQSENDAEMALNSSRILYDMDSDDEQWVLMNCSSSDGNKSSLGEINNDIFEKAIDIFEKTSFVEHNDHFTYDGLRTLATGIGSVEVVKGIYEYWQQKRKRKGLPLIRHFQPPLWKRYHEQVTEWELSIGKQNSLLASSSCTFPEKAVTDKPPMFAFCLKPRGLETPRNKCLKQRSYKKFHISGKHINNNNSGKYGLPEEAFRPSGVRSLKSFGFGCSTRSPDFASARSTPLPFPPSYGGSLQRCFSPTVTGSDYTDGRIFYPRFQRSRSNKFREVASRSDGSTGGPVHRSPGECSSAEYMTDKTEFDEFRLRQALGAAQQGLIMAKLKREKAQRLLYRADLAIHKAVVALMMAEEIKGSS